LHNDDDRTILAQFPRRGPGPSFPPHSGYSPRENYQTPWLNHGDAGHTVIGAAIGFGIGAALGGIGSARNHTPIGDGVLLGGSLCALIGGAIGASHGSPYYFAHHHRIHPPWSGGNDQSTAQSGSNKGRGERGMTAPVGSRGQESLANAGTVASSTKPAHRPNRM
jgi:hypothetical protein